MPEVPSTLKDSDNTLFSDDNRPGLVLLFSCGRPAATFIPWSGGVVELGRGTQGLGGDPRISRRHAQVALQGSRFLVTDLGSQNGTACDGAPISPNVPVEVERVIRIGDSLIGVCQAVLPLLEKGVRIDNGMVLSPALQDLLATIKQAAQFGETLHITGESGTGKELFARAFHEHGPQRKGPFVPVNCAAIPQSLAERLLFGARRGAYSGAHADAEGYVQAAAGGTLFLDEVGDLDLNVQAKLLRTLESREVLPLGANRPQAIGELHLCSATNKDLKAQVAAGAFREDLYYRIGRPMVAIPPLRKRTEEIPWLIDAVLRRTTSAPPVHTSLVEACLLLPWPGNVRELLVEVRSAAQSATFQRCPRVESRHLPAGAGTFLHASSDSIGEQISSPPPVSHPPAAAPKALDPAEHARLEAALRQNRGNVSGAARSLGIHRTQLRRLLERHGLDSQRYGTGNKAPVDLDD